MRKMINGKKNINLKRIMTIIVIVIFLLYTSLVLLISNRKYFFVEKVFKSISSNINTFLINNSYKVNPYSLNTTSLRIKYLEKENESLRREIDASKVSSKYLVSEVTNHKSKTWFDKVTINNGYRKKVENDLPVINSYGLVGFISKTGRDISEVSLLTSVGKNKKIPILIETEEGTIAGVLSSYDNKKDLFKITDVTNKMNVSEGSIVSLAGYENETYKGIYIGRVVEEENSNYGLSRTIWVKSSVNFNDLLFVSVVVKE